MINVASVWQNNKYLRSWEQKEFKKNSNGDFNYNLAYPQSDPLVNSIANSLKIPSSDIYVGCGISQLIEVLVSLPIWENIYIPEIEFSLYQRIANAYDKNIKLIKGVYLSDVIDNIILLKSNINDLLCISTPRWFDGEKITISQAKKIAKSFKGTIIFDEAYVDFSNDCSGLINLYKDYPNIILFRSFSKKFLAPGYRVGYMITKKKIDNLRETIIPPHSVSSYSANFFIDLLSNKKILNMFNCTRDYIKNNRDLLYYSLLNYSDFKVIKSESNFITLMFNNSNKCNKIYEKLNKYNGIQKFDNKCYFIKIWVSNEKFSNEIIRIIKGECQ